MPGCETSKVIEDIRDYCVGLGVDFGCETDPNPYCDVLVDEQQLTAKKFEGQVNPVTGKPYEVHIRDIDKGFSLDGDEASWKDGRFDFVYSSHCIEHIESPKDFLTTCMRIIKPGGHLIIVGPHEDWYWPNGHPQANPDHSKFNWSLNQDRVRKWVMAIAKSLNMPFESLLCEEYGWDKDNWSFVIVLKKYAAPRKLSPGR